jgi:hypothetical protein
MNDLSSANHRLPYLSAALGTPFLRLTQDGIGRSCPAYIPTQKVTWRSRKVLKELSRYIKMFAAQCLLFLFPPIISHFIEIQGQTACTGKPSRYQFKFKEITVHYVTKIWALQGICSWGHNCGNLATRTGGHQHDSHACDWTQNKDISNQHNKIPAKSFFGGQ